MDIIHVTKACQCGEILLIQLEGKDELIGYDMDKFKHTILDFYKCKFYNVVPWTDFLEQRTRKKVSKRDVRNLRILQDNCCLYCYNSLEYTGYQVDHIIPISFGGSSKINNLALTCPKCNLAKSKKLFPDLFSIREYIANLQKHGF